MPVEYCPSQIFLCTEFFGEPYAFNDEMENARFEPFSEIRKHEMFLPFRMSVEEFVAELNDLRSLPQMQDAEERGVQDG